MSVRDWSIYARCNDCGADIGQPCVTLGRNAGHPKTKRHSTRQQIQPARPTPMSDDEIITGAALFDTLLGGTAALLDAVRMARRAFIGNAVAGRSLGEVAELLNVAKQHIAGLAGLYDASDVERTRIDVIKQLQLLIDTASTQLVHSDDGNPSVTERTLTGKAFDTGRT